MKIISQSPFSKDAKFLMDELSASLETITGSTGKVNFNPEDVCETRALFVIAYDDEGEAVGCGSFRPMNEEIAEVKRMYAKYKGKGIGTEILSYLENQAKTMGYSKILLETRLINEQATSFYKSRGYDVIDNYGVYKNRPEAVCFEKILL